jgi:hypothetical protein
MNVFATKTDLIKLVDNFLKEEDEPEYDFSFVFDRD